MLTTNGRACSAWGVQGRLAKHVLEKLFAHGRVLISARRNFRRVYDLPERVLPRTVLDRPARTKEETSRLGRAAAPQTTAARHVDSE
jgi:uncharacterized protein YcaQ